MALVKVRQVFREKGDMKSLFKPTADWGPCMGNPHMKAKLEAGKATGNFSDSSNHANGVHVAGPEIVKTAGYPMQEYNGDSATPNSHMNGSSDARLENQ